MLKYGINIIFKPIFTKKICLFVVSALKKAKFCAPFFLIKEAFLDYL